MENQKKAVLLILIGKAMSGTLATYEELAISTGLPSQGKAMSQAVSTILYDLLRWCKDRGYPPLTSLVVRKSGTAKGIPGNGFWEEIGKSDLNLEERRELTKQYHDEIYRLFSM